ncbi:MAG: hypothetical protein GXP54_06580 [Deltaproteobacteria bacterium]|nr:hypothetical protein [Deltaproteobacteria bacterium]
METFAQYAFRAVMYAIMGMALEVIGAVDGIDRILGFHLERRVPKKYLEGFVSLYMIPLHGFGMLFGFEAVRDLTGDWFIGFRYLVWCVVFTLAEAAWGFLLDRTVGFYTWDYYRNSRFKVFKRGYTLWTLVPVWGVVGLFLEVYSDLLRHLSPYAAAFFASM